MKICCAASLICFLLLAAMVSSSGKEEFIFSYPSFTINIYHVLLWKYDVIFLSKFSVLLSTSQISALNGKLFVARTCKLSVGSDVVNFEQTVVKRAGKLSYIVEGVAVHSREL